MSVQNLFNEIIEKKHITYEQLSKELKIPYSTITALKNGFTKQLSKKIVLKLSNYLNESESAIIFKSIADREISKICSDNALYHLSNMFCSDLGVDFGYKENQFQFCGAYYKKRSLNSFTLVDDWNMLVTEYWNTNFKKVHPILFDFQSEKEIFLNDEAYLSSILYYGIKKAQSVTNVNVVNYDIIFNDEKTMNKIEHLLPYKSGININPLIPSLEPQLKYDEYLHINKEDIAFFDSIYRYVTYSNTEFPINHWIAALQCNKIIIPFVKPNIEYAYAKISDAQISEPLSLKEVEGLSLNEEYELYLNNQITYLQNNPDTSRLSFQRILSPIYSTVSQGNLTYGQFKLILLALKPIISTYLINEKDPMQLPLFF